MVEFAWFYILKALIIGVVLYFAGKPFYDRFKAEGDFKVTKKYPYFLIGLFVILVFFSPIKIDNSTKADMMRTSYDTPVVETKEIVLQPKKNYRADSNEERIKRITETETESN